MSGATDVTRVAGVAIAARPVAARSLLDRLLLAGLALLGVLLLGPVLIIPLHIPLGYNEGWNAYFDLRAVTPGAGPLYPPAGGMVFNNYPPLSFYIVGLLGRFVFGDMIVAGRAVALAAMLASGALLCLCVRRLGGCLRASLAAGLLLPLFGASFYHYYVASNDPQWLAQALMLGGLALLLRTPGRKADADVVLAALLMLAGGFVKHNLVGMPLSVTLWLCWSDRRAALLFVATATAGLLAGLALCDALYGPAVFTNVLQHQRIMQYSRLLRAALNLIFLLPMLIMAATLLARHRRRDPAIAFAALFIGISFTTGLLQRAGEGVYYNAHFETLVAVCLGFGLAVSQVIQGRRPGNPAAWLAFAALPLALNAPTSLPRAWTDIHDATAREASWRPIIAQVATTDGIAGCETLSICYWAGKPFTLDMFNFTQAIQSGSSAAPFAALVATRRLAIFEYEPASSIHRDTVRQLGADPLLSLVAGPYQHVGRGPEGTVLVAPRPPAQGNRRV